VGIELLVKTTHNSSHTRLLINAIKNMYNLKDGTQVKDCRLDRLIEFDEKSRNFPISSLHPSKKPRSYTWRNTEWYDQKSEGACVAFALGHELNARPSEIKNISEEWLVKGVYWQAQKNDQWPGGSYPGANPFYEGTSIIAGVKVLQKAGAFNEYRWAFNMNDIILGVGYNGPAVIGVNWYEGMFNTDKDGYIKPTGYFAGGHAVVLKSVNITKKIFTIRNSWGRQWGKNGECYITFDDLNTLMRQRGECVFLMKRNSKFNNFTY
jgi:hypothetical protein